MKLSNWVDVDPQASRDQATTTVPRSEPTPRWFRNFLLVSLILVAVALLGEATLRSGHREAASGISSAPIEKTNALFLTPVRRHTSPRR